MTTTRGRPKLPPGQSKADVLTLRLQPAEREAIEAAAKIAGQSLSDFVRDKTLPKPKAKDPSASQLHWTEDGVTVNLETSDALPPALWKRLVGYVTDVLKPEDR